MNEREFCQSCGVEKTDRSPVGHNENYTGVRVWWCSMWCWAKPTCAESGNPLLLIRGLPGSGKSTMAKSVIARGFYDTHLEADMFHMERGQYAYRTTSAIAAHSWCLNTTRVMLNNGKRVVVSNTFVQLEEVEPYLRLGFGADVVVARGKWSNTHGVPTEVLDHMRKRWQEF